MVYGKVPRIMSTFTKYILAGSTTSSCILFL